MKKFREICKNCSFSFGSHRVDDMMCPATEGGVDFAYGNQTKFKPTGEYIEQGKDSTKSGDTGKEVIHIR